MKKSSGIRAIGFWLCLAASLCLADQSDVTSQPHLQMNLTVTGSRYVSTYPNSQVISEEEIHAYKDLTVGDVLQTQSGIQVISNGGKGGVVSLFLQGTNSNQTLVLLDGIPLKNPIYGTVDFNNLNLDRIQMIQVYQGGMSAVYGADAVGGVVNLISDKVLNKGKLSFEYGSFNNQNIYFDYGLGSVNSNYRVSFMDGKYAGYLPVGYFNNDNLAMEYNGKIGSDLAYRFMGSGYADQRGNPAIPGFSASEQTDNGYSAQIQLSQLNDEVETGKLYFSTRYDERDKVSGQITNSKAWMNVLGGNKEVNLGSHVLLLGVDANQMIPNDETLLQEVMLQNVGVFVNDDLTLLPWWKANLGVRRDMHSVYGAANTYKLSSGFSFNKDSGLKVSYGTSFRAPTLSDLYSSDGWGDNGNPNLKPETAKNLNVELSMKTLVGTTRLSYFENLVTDLIEWQAIDASDPYSPWSPNNVGNARLSGIEAQWVGGFAENVMAEVNLTQLLDAQDQSNGEWLQDRARTQANVALSTMLFEGKLGVRANFVSERSSSEGGALNLPRYYVVDVDYTKDNVSLYVHNFFNRDYQENFNYPMPGRTAGIKVTYSL